MRNNRSGTAKVTQVTIGQNAMTVACRVWHDCFGVLHAFDNHRRSTSLVFSSSAFGPGVTATHSSWRAADVLQTKVLDPDTRVGCTCRAKRSRTLPRGGTLPERPDSPGDVTRRGLTRRLANFLGISSPQRSMTSSPTPDATQQVGKVPSSDAELPRSCLRR